MGQSLDVTQSSDVYDVGVEGTFVIQKTPSMETGEDCFMLWGNSGLCNIDRIAGYGHCTCMQGYLAGPDVSMYEALKIFGH